MNIFDKLKEHKNNGTSLTIIIILLATFGVTSGIDAYNVYGTNNFLIPFTFEIIKYLTLALSIFLLEKKGSSFASHLVFLLLITGNAIFKLFNTSTTLSLLDNLKMVLGVFSSIYFILKLIAHKNELNRYLGNFNRTVLFFIIFSLIRVYLDGGINITSTYGIIFFLILFSSRQENAIPLALTVFINGLLNQVSFILLFNLDSLDFIRLTINILFNVYFIYYGLKAYLALSSNNHYYN